VSAEAWTIRPIGVVRSVYRDKFGIPRQPGLSPSARAVVELDEAVCPGAALRGLEGFSHVWVVFGFHAAHDERFTVRPPRLGAARRAGAEVPSRMGVLATRSPHRPNRLGLSAVRILAVHAASVELGGADLLDGTPVFDLKPYLPYADALPDATSGWATGELTRSVVQWTPEAETQLAAAPGLREVVDEALSLDPRRPGARDGTYGVRLDAWDVKCTVSAGIWTVLALHPLAPEAGPEQTSSYINPRDVGHPSTELTEGRGALSGFSVVFPTPEEHEP